MDEKEVWESLEIWTSCQMIPDGVEKAVMKLFRKHRNLIANVTTDGSRLGVYLNPKATIGELYKFLDEANHLPCSPPITATFKDEFELGYYLEIVYHPEWLKDWLEIRKLARC